VKIPLSGPDITQVEIDAVVSVMRSGRLSLGPKLEEFERAVANYVNAPFAAAVSSGTAGLHLMIRALGIGERDEVIIPSFTFIAAANAIRFERATPVFVEIDPRDLNLDPAAVEAAISERTRAILAVHTFGVPANLTALVEIAARHNLLLIEDACESIGAEWHGRKVGTFGKAGVFGFYPNKQITTAEGGVVVTSDEALAAKVRSLRNQGRTEIGDWFEHTEVGYNYRLSEIHAAIGVEQLERIDQILVRRAEVARGYARRLARCKEIVLPTSELPQGKISWFVYVIRLSESFTRVQRDAILKMMTEHRIGCGRYFAPIHLQKPYCHENKKLPITEGAADRTIALPFFNALTDDEMDEVCETLEASITAASELRTAAKSA
jgi:perosamine synthetase